MENGPYYQKHYYQVREIGGRQHYQIFTELGTGVSANASRSTKGRRTDLKHTFTLVLCVIACIEFRNPAHELPFVDFSLRHSTDEDTTTHHKTWSQSKEAA